MDTQQLARNQLDGILRAATYISGINYEQRIKELEKQNAEMLRILKEVKMDIEFESLGLGDLKKRIGQALRRVNDGR